MAKGPIRFKPRQPTPFPFPETRRYFRMVAGYVRAAEREAGPAVKQCDFLLKSARRELRLAAATLRHPYPSHSAGEYEAAAMFFVGRAFECAQEAKRR